MCRADWILRLKVVCIGSIIKTRMNEEPTQNLSGTRSFEERVFARFDAFDARFDTVDARLEKLESRAYDTKPIWQRALKAIMEMGLEMGEVKSKVGVIERKVGVIEGKVGLIEGKVGLIEGKVGLIEGKVGGIETKVQLLENEIGVMKTDQRGIRNELVDVRRELKHQVSERLDLILKFLLEDREDIRDAEARIRELESKFA
jgi:chromosome segregation ATPase